ncbi:MAG TPA: ribose-phosphate diphosphokinase, partial [Chromatiales bacterium]|nr:ribose-phosphate diphosphokinase [Chromatiales bacterium]
ASLPARVIVCQSLDRPNSKLVELILTADTARRLGAEHLTMVSPYLCYMRQDKAFHAGESVSQQIIGRMLANAFDALLTVDPHLHRVRRLDQAVPVDPAIALHATEPMARFLADRLDDPLLVGPDEESEQWVAAIAAHNRLDYRVARKRRYGDHSVSIELSDGPYRDRHIVLVDDVASTGRTLEVAAEQIQRQEPASISILVTHALFLEGSLERLNGRGIRNIWSTDSVIHSTNVIQLDELIATALQAPRLVRH